MRPRAGTSSDSAAAAGGPEHRSGVHRRPARVAVLGGTAGAAGLAKVWSKAALALGIEAALVGDFPGKAGIVGMKVPGSARGEAFADRAGTSGSALGLAVAARWLPQPGSERQQQLALPCSLHNCTPVQICHFSACALADQRADAAGSSGMGSAVAASLHRE